MDRHLLVTDVDDTMLGDEQALDRFSTWYVDSRQRLDIAYASGRSAASIEESVRADGLPTPVAIIGGVGTEMVRFPDGVRIADWPDRVLERWSAPGVRRSLDSEPDLTLQPETSQSAHKVSYVAPGLEPSRLDSLHARLSDDGLDADLVYSSDRDLDVVPRGVDKGTATRELAAQLDVPAERVLVAGNSLNDLALFRSDFRGIVVGNADPALRAALSDAPVPAYMATLDHAEGVLQGLIHWFGETPEETP